MFTKINFILNVRHRGTNKEIIEGIKTVSIISVKIRVKTLRVTIISRYCIAAEFRVSDPARPRPQRGLA